MLCSHCNKKEANFHYKQIENGVARELFLCSDCARELGYMSESFGFENILSDFLSFPVHKAVNSIKKACPSCKTSYDEFKKTGLLGCDKCYESFEDIDSILSRIQPSVTHKGKIAGAKGEMMSKKNELKELKEKLSKAIMDERYEEAIVLRDRIKEMESEGGING